MQHTSVMDVGLEWIGYSFNFASCIVSFMLYRYSSMSLSCQDCSRRGMVQPTGFDCIGMPKASQHHLNIKIHTASPSTPVASHDAYSMSDDASQVQAANATFTARAGA